MALEDGHLNVQDSPLRPSANGGEADNAAEMLRPKRARAICDDAETPAAEAAVGVEEVPSRQAVAGKDGNLEAQFEMTLG